MRGTTKAEGCSCSAARQASRHLSRYYDEALAPAGLSLNQYAILSNAFDYGPQTIQSLADRLVMDRSTLGHLLRPLEARGWLAIAPHATNKRQRVIVSTKAGKETLFLARGLWVEAERGFEQAFGVEDAATFRRLMSRIVAMDLQVASK